MNDYNPVDLSNAIAAICPEVQARALASEFGRCERQAWWELSACILSSQVPYSMAVAAANRIEQEGLLTAGRRNLHKLRTSLQRALQKPLVVDGMTRRYRFANSRAAQLAGAHEVLVNGGSSLFAQLDKFPSELKAREWLVAVVPGLGPKQASMFLRNIGYSYELAVIDRHVLSYMAVLGMFPAAGKSISTLREYRKHELALRVHARAFACPIGFLDWAIWIVMRVAGSTRPLVAR